MADKDSQRPGFSLCRHCGKVQKPARRGGQAAEQNHGFDCAKHGSDDPANLLACLYLYREFESEALRILVPYTKNGVDEAVVQSFMAAVQLGLKRRFGGKVDHLRMVLQDEPGKDGGPRKHFVMLYDSVPGGTGYLHQLLAHDARTLADVLRMALDALTTCSCNQDPEKDGCYRCLYQYRLGRSMELVSRDNAKAVLTELVGSLGALERVKTISDIYINPNFDSVLEARFIESMKKLGGVGGLPVVKLIQDVVNGKSGFVLEVGAQRYRVEPQAELNADHGVVVPSKPDFVIWPWASGSKRRPVAVFCDGWVYHKDCMPDDALKRSAIVASGRYWVWSVTHQDVASALAVNLDTDLESPLVAMSRHDGAIAPETVPRAQEKAFTHHAVTRLLQWLALGSDGGDADPAVEVMQRNAAWLEFLMIPNTPDDKAACDGQRAHWLPRLPLYIREPGTGYAPVMSRANGPVMIVGWWAMALAKGFPITGAWSSPGAVVVDESAGADEDGLHRGWRRWLQLYNTAQFLPGVLMATASGLAAHDYESLGAMGGGPQAPGRPHGHAGVSAAWLTVLEQTLSELSAGLKALAGAGATSPEVGTELADEKGKVLADAELTWVDQKLALLRPDQADLADAWQAAGWTAQVLDDQLATIQGQPWLVVVAGALGLTLKNEQE